MKTKAAILFRTGDPLQITEIHIPPLKPGQVLVKIAYTGLCHSQLNEIKGLKGNDPYLPHTLGHEGSGIVVAVGEGIQKVKLEDPVVLSWIKGSGADVPSTLYECQGMRVNSGAISTFQTYSIISENRLIPIPPEMPLKEAALLGCALPTGAGVIRHEMKLSAKHSFAVFGVGGVGLSALLAAKDVQANPLIAIDVHEEKLTRAASLGATHLVNARFVDPLQAILEITGGKGVDYVFEAAGKKEAMEQGFACLKAPGLCVLAGNLPKGHTISIDPFELIRGKRIIGTWGGASRIDEDVAYYAGQYLKKRIDVGPLITHEGSLEDINDLFDAMDKGQVGRAVIKL